MREKDIERDLQRLRQREDRVVDDLYDERLPREVAERQLARIAEERMRLHSAQVHTQKDPLALLEPLQGAFEFSKHAKDLYNQQPPHEQRRLLETVLSNSRLRGRSVEYEYKKPFGFLAKMPKGCPWRARNDSNVRPSDS